MPCQWLWECHDCYPASSTARRAVRSVTPLRASSTCASTPLPVPQPASACSPLKNVTVRVVHFRTALRYLPSLSCALCPTALALCAGSSAASMSSTCVAFLFVPACRGSISMGRRYKHSLVGVELCKEPQGSLRQPITLPSICNTTILSACILASVLVLTSFVGPLRTFAGPGFS